MKYIQSFYQYPVTFSSIGKTIPAKGATGDLRNIAEFEDKEIDVLQEREPFFRSLVDRKKIRVLNKLPESYKPSSVLVNEARAEAEKAMAENEALKARLAELEGAKPEETEGGAEAENENKGPKKSTKKSNK